MTWKDSISRIRGLPGLYVLILYRHFLHSLLCKKKKTFLNKKKGYKNHEFLRHIPEERKTHLAI
jgi:hypothetical protein